MAHYVPEILTCFSLVTLLMGEAMRRQRADIRRAIAANDELQRRAIRAERNVNNVIDRLERVGF